MKLKIMLSVALIMFSAMAFTMERQQLIESKSYWSTDLSINEQVFVLHKDKIKDVKITGFSSNNANEITALGSGKTINVDDIARSSGLHNSTVGQAVTFENVCECCCGSRESVGTVKGFFQNGDILVSKVCKKKTKGYRVKEVFPVATEIKKSNGKKVSATWAIFDVL